MHKFKSKEEKRAAYLRFLNLTRDGVSHTEAAGRIGVSAPTAYAWTKVFGKEGNENNPYPVFGAVKKNKGGRPPGKSKKTKKTDIKSIDLNDFKEIITKKTDATATETPPQKEKEELITAIIFRGTPNGIAAAIGSSTLWN